MEIYNSYKIITTINEKIFIKGEFILKYEGMIYRPPMEANDILLQVAVGCTHNQCTFCNMFKDKQFHLVDETTIIENLKEARLFYHNANRVFLVDGDAFCLSADRLKRIATLIHHYLPDCETITMYSSIANIKTKTDSELVELRDIGINDLYVGIESGLDDVLISIRKGHLVSDAILQLNRLNKAKIRHSMLLITGIAGKGRGIESGIAAAKLANETKPFLIVPTTIGLFEGTVLSEQAKRGEFIEAGEKENLQEQQAFLEHVDLPQTFYWAGHALNSTPIMGFLNDEEKAKMILTLKENIDTIDDDAFKEHFKRTSL